jgi:hypothetical protein
MGGRLRWGRGIGVEGGSGAKPKMNKAILLDKFY